MALKHVERIGLSVNLELTCISLVIILVDYFSPWILSPITPKRANQQGNTKNWEGDEGG